MADEQDLSKRIGLTRGKIVLIAILAVVLVGVIYTQYGPDGTEEVVAVSEPAYAPPTPPLPQPAGNSTSTTAGPTGSTESAGTAPTGALPASTDGRSGRLSGAMDQAKWRSPNVDRIVEYDPFASPPSFPRQAQLAGDPQGLLRGEAEAESAQARASKLADAVAQLHTELESLRQRGVHVIVKQHDGYVAMIGDRTVRVGDEINGFTVTSIDQNGVRVERNVQQ